MKTPNHNAHKGFYLGLASLFFFTAVFVFMEYFYHLLSSTDTFVVLLLGSAFGVTSVLGLISSFKGVKEPYSFKKNSGFVLNSVLVLLFLYFLILYIFDLS